jgi:hypothetical protein
MPDKYDKAIAYLSEHPEEIGDAWTKPHIHRAGCLFEFLTPTGEAIYHGTYCGCPSIVKSGDAPACTKELTAAVKRNRGIPKLVHTLRVKHLPAFAEIQRLADKVLKRKKDVEAIKPKQRWKEARTDNINLELRVMAIAEGYVMCRFLHCSPFAISMQDFRKRFIYVREK